jgi:hypothetical protein
MFQFLYGSLGLLGLAVRANKEATLEEGRK